MKRSKMHQDFARKAALRDCYADGGMIGNAQSAIAAHRTALDNAGAAPKPVAAPAPAPAASTQPAYTDPLTLQLEAAARQRAVAQPPVQKSGLRQLFGFADGGAVEGGDGEEYDSAAPRLMVRSARDLYMAHGGRVRGPGGPTADKVPAMLSDGEYVLPADTTAAVGVDKLDALRAQTHTPAHKQSLRQHYADGGWTQTPEAQAYQAQQDALRNEELFQGPRQPRSAPALSPEAQNYLSSRSGPPAPTAPQIADRIAAQAVAPTQTMGPSGEALRAPPQAAPAAPPVEPPMVEVPAAGTPGSAPGAKPTMAQNLRNVGGTAKSAAGSAVNTLRSLPGTINQGAGSLVGKAAKFALKVAAPYQAGQAALAGVGDNPSDGPGGSEQALRIGNAVQSGALDYGQPGGTLLHYGSKLFDPADVGTTVMSAGNFARRFADNMTGGIVPGLSPKPVAAATGSPAPGAQDTAPATPPPAFNPDDLANNNARRNLLRTGGTPGASANIGNYGGNGDITAHFDPRTGRTNSFSGVGTGQSKWEQTPEYAAAWQRLNNDKAEGDQYVAGLVASGDLEGANQVARTGSARALVAQGYADRQAKAAAAGSNGSAERDMIVNSKLGPAHKAAALRAIDESAISRSRLAQEAQLHRETTAEAHYGHNLTAQSARATNQLAMYNALREQGNKDREHGFNVDKFGNEIGQQRSKTIDDYLTSAFPTPDGKGVDKNASQNFKDFAYRSAPKVLGQSLEQVPQHELHRQLAKLHDKYDEAQQSNAKAQEALIGGYSTQKAVNVKPGGEATFGMTADGLPVKDRLRTLPGVNIIPGVGTHGNKNVVMVGNQPVLENDYLRNGDGTINETRRATLDEARRKGLRQQ